MISVLSFRALLHVDLKSSVLLLVMIFSPPSNITASAILMLIACLFHAGGMGLWHGVEHWERNKIMTKSDTELFTDTWDETLRNNTEFKYDWSYIVAWIGVGLALIAPLGSAAAY